MKRFLLLLIIIGSSFALGWSANTYASLYSEQPVSFASRPQNLLSPADHVSEDQINVYDDRIIIDISNAIWSKFAPTRSMDPFLDSGANGIEIRPKSISDINPGDVISYHSEIANSLIIHRVVKIDFDEQGWYAVAKGDNNSENDPEKIRFDMINGVLVGIIY